MFLFLNVYIKLFKGFSTYLFQVWELWLCSWFFFFIEKNWIFIKTYWLATLTINSWVHASLYKSIWVYQKTILSISYSSISKNVEIVRSNVMMEFEIRLSHLCVCEFILTKLIIKASMFGLVARVWVVCMRFWLWFSTTLYIHKKKNTNICTIPLIFSS
jgi:hypothetical protein